MSILHKFATLLPTLLLASCSDDLPPDQPQATGGAGASMSGGTGGAKESGTGGRASVTPPGEPAVECETRPSCNSDVLGVWQLTDNCGRRGVTPFPGCELASGEWDITGIDGELVLKESGECSWSYIIEKT